MLPFEKLLNFRSVMSIARSVCASTDAVTGHDRYRIRVNDIESMMTLGFLVGVHIVEQQSPTQIALRKRLAGLLLATGTRPSMYLIGGK